jgi:DNA-binding SARP family transcriptional activator
MLGKFQVEYDGQVLAGFEANKVQELFSFLLLYSERAHHRETLASLLWPNNSTAQSKRYLSRVIWQLQTAVKEANEEIADKLLQVKPDWIQLNLNAFLWADVVVFEEAYNSVIGASGTHLDNEKAIRLRNAVKMYQDDLLQGCYEDWCLFERERFQLMLLNSLDKLMLYCEVEGAYEAGLTYGTKILRYDRARECTHRRLMRLHLLAGDRTGALRQYERCVTILLEDLGIEPSENTQKLYQIVRFDHLNGHHSNEHAPENSLKKSKELSSFTTILGRLDRLQVTLNTVQKQIQMELDQMRSFLQD